MVINLFRSYSSACRFKLQTLGDLWTHKILLRNEGGRYASLAHLQATCCIHVVSGHLTLLRLSGQWVGCGVCKFYASARGSMSWPSRICKGEHVCLQREVSTTLDVTLWRTILHPREGWMMDRYLAKWCCVYLKGFTMDKNVESILEIAVTCLSQCSRT